MLYISVASSGGNTRALDSICQYRCLVLLVKMYNDIYSVTMMASKTMLAGVAIVSLCFSIRHKDLMGGIAGVVGADLALVVTVAFSCLAELQSKSQKVIRALEVATHVREKSWKKSVGALRIMAFRMGRFYYVDKAMVLTLLELIVTALANMLLLLSK